MQAWMLFRKIVPSDQSTGEMVQSSCSSNRTHLVVLMYNTIDASYLSGFITATTDNGHFYTYDIRTGLGNETSHFHYNYQEGLYTHKRYSSNSVLLGADGGYLSLLDLRMNRM